MACSSCSFLGSQIGPFEPDNEVSLPPKMAPSNRTTKYLFPEMIASCRNPKYLFPKWLLDALRTGTRSIFLEDSKYLRPKRPLRSGTRSIFGRYSAPRTSLFPMEVCDLSLESLRRDTVQVHVAGAAIFTCTCTTTVLRMKRNAGD